MDPEDDTSQQADSVVTEAVIDGVAWITLNRPRSINAMNSAMRRELAGAFASAAVDPDVHVLIVMGAGDRGFCSGADTKEIKPIESALSECQNRLNAYDSWHHVLERVGKPVVAAVHGHCHGGGLELAVACDIRVASSDAVFSLPEIRLGSMPGAGGLQHLVRLVGIGHALDLALTGERIDANHAHRCGLVTRLVEDQVQLRAEAARIGAILASHPLPAATVLIKEALRAGSEVPLHAALRVDQGLVSMLLASPERAALLARRRDVKEHLRVPGGDGAGPGG